MTHNKASGSEGLSKLLADAADWVESVHDGEWPYHPFTRDELVERLRAASPAPLSEGAGVRDLYAAIMNVPCRRPPDGWGALQWSGYKEGHRDARHAAAELVAAATPSGSEGAGTTQPPECEYPKCECPILGIAPQCGKHTGRYKPAASSMNQNEKHGTGDVGRGGER